MYRRWLLFFLLLFLVQVGAAVLVWPRDHVTPEACSRIQPGMTEREVEKILGRSADCQVVVGPVKRHLISYPLLARNGGEKKELVWLGSNWWVEVDFQDGVVSDKRYGQSKSSPVALA